MITCYFTSGTALGKQLNIAFFPLSEGENHNLYWQDVVDFARASASDLNINLHVIYNKVGHRRSYVSTIESILKSDDKPDAFIAGAYLQITEEIIALAEYYQVPLIMFNNELPKQAMVEVGPPRSKYQYFIGQVMPDDLNLGYMLADYLIKNAEKRSTTDRIKIVGISGTRDSPETHARNQGLTNASAEHDQADLVQIVFSNWNPDIAYRQANSLINRHQDLQIIWCASDLMALSSLNAIKDNKQHIISGGIDWSADAMHSIRNGQLTASSGGQFTTGGYAVILLYDYLNGRDFAQDNQTIFKIPGGLIHQENIEQYFSVLTAKDWKSINFGLYSRALHPENTGYDFSFERLMTQAQASKVPVASPSSSKQLLLE